MKTRYLLFSEPIIPDKTEVHCEKCGGRWTIDSDSPVGICKCGIPFTVDMPIIQSGLFCWVQAFREQGGVGEMYPTIEKDYLERYDIVHINYTPGHPNYIEAVRNSLGKSDTKIVANVDYAMSMWETINPFNMKQQLGMADMVFHVESMGAYALQRFLGRVVHTIPHPVDVKHLKMVKRTPDEKPLATCQWHRYGATWSSYYYGMLGIDIKKFLVAFVGPGPQQLVNLETMFDRVVPAMQYVPYIQDVLNKATINLDLAPDMTFGRGLIDAAALGIPSVASETIEAARNIWPELTVRPHNHGDVARKTKKLLTDRNFYADMAQRGLERSESYSCASAYNRMMEALYGNG